ncbi:MAG: DUF116 domain-containing protein [Cyanobacteria bacterium]|nr:DUF116 domain-containing protein [Cyanobacteriota bacterium]
MGKYSIFRVIDTGPLSAAENMALDQTILEACEKDITCDTIRFLSFDPHCVLVGSFQTVEKEIRTAYCKEQNIDINRRITGGGALYWDTKDVGWEIFSTFNGVFKSKNIESFYSLFCSAVSEGINNFGIKSNFRRRNDIEVNGKKISGSGGTSLGKAFMFQGTLLVDLNIDIMLRALRIPVEKLKYKEINSLKERITWLSRELGYCPSRNEIIENILKGLKCNLKIEFFKGELSSEEQKIFKEKLNYFKSRKYIYKVREKKNTFFLTSFTKSEKKVIKCTANIDIRRNVLRNTVFSGDFFAYPERVVNDIESILKNLPADIEKIEMAVKKFFNDYPLKISGINQEDILLSIKTCIDKIKFKKYLIPLKYFNDIYLINSELNTKNKIEVFLLPYCAKLPDCRYRKKDGCSICCKCSTGDAIGIAKKYNVKTLTILSYEHLKKTLIRLKKKGIRYFGGSCCESFYIKHKEDFERIGLAGILLNIDNKTCYDLGREAIAHEGKFEGFTDLKLPLLEKVFKILT